MMISQVQYITDQQGNRTGVLLDLLDEILKTVDYLNILPDSHTPTALFRPNQDRWSDHFQWDDSGQLLIGLTPIGRMTVDLLCMNRPQMQRVQRMWTVVGEHPMQTEKS